MAKVVECDVVPLTEEKVVKWINSLGRADQVELPAEEIRVVRCLVEDDALAVLAPNVLHRCPYLTHLDLSGNSITDEGCIVLAECIGALQSSGDAVRLRSLLLGGNCIGAEGAEALAWKFFPAPPPSTDESSSSSRSTVYRLDFSENPLGDRGVQAIAQAVRHRQCRASLHLVDVSCGAAGGQALAEAASWFVSLALSHNAGIPAVVLTNLVRYIGTSLQDLALAHLNFRSAAAEALAASLSRCLSLSTLGLAGLNMHDVGLRQLTGPICESGCPSLLELDLAGNRLQDGNLLAQLLVNAFPCLRGLNLECNELEDVALVALSAGLALSPRLQRLNLARNRFGDSGAVALARTIQQQSEAFGDASRSADLSDDIVVDWLLGVCVHASSSSSDTGARQGSVLRATGGVQELDLSFNSIMDRGACALAEAIAGKERSVQPSLSNLNLYDTSIGHEGQQAISQAMEERHRRVTQVAKRASHVFSAAAAVATDEELTALCRPSLPQPFKVQGLELEAQQERFAKQSRCAVRELPDHLLRQAGCPPALMTKRLSSPAVETASRLPSPVIRVPSPLAGSLVREPSPMAEASQQGQSSEAPTDPAVLGSLLEMLAQAQAQSLPPSEEGAAASAPLNATNSRASTPIPHAAASSAEPSPRMTVPLPFPPEEAQALSAQAPTTSADGRLSHANQSPALSPAAAAAAAVAAAAAGDVLREDHGCTAPSDSPPAAEPAKPAASDRPLSIAEAAILRAQQVMNAGKAGKKSPPTGDASREQVNQQSGSGVAAGVPAPAVSPQTPALEATSQGQPVHLHIGNKAENGNGQELRLEHVPAADPPQPPSNENASQNIPQVIGEANVLKAGEQMCNELQAPNHGAEILPSNPSLKLGLPEKKPEDGSGGANTQLSHAEAVIRRAREALTRVKGHSSAAPDSTLPAPPPPPPALEEPEMEAPSQEAGPASNERVQRLEREVAELQKDVRRIDDTVTRLNPEPEQEQDLATPDFSPRSQSQLGSTGEACVPEIPSSVSCPQLEPHVPPVPSSLSCPQLQAQEPEPEAQQCRTESDATPKAAPAESEKKEEVEAPKPEVAKPKSRPGKAPAPPPPPKGRGPPLPKGRAPAFPGKAKAKEAAAPDPTPFNRRLYWKPIDISEDGGTIFDHMRREDSRRTSFDATALQKIFSGESDRIRERARRSTMVLSRQQKKAQGLKLLSDTRARNVAIVLKRLPCSTSELSSILWHLRWEATRIGTDDLEQIVEVIPSQEEAEALRKHKEPEAREALRDIERMVLPLALIKRGAARVRLLIMARNAKASFKASSRSLAQIRAACQSIQRSLMLREVMALALDLGNYINHGDSRRGARAISISSLSTLKDFKAGKISSLHFLCASLHLSHPERDAAEVLARELKAATSASQLQVSAILSGVRSMARDCEIVRTECTNFLHEYTQEVDVHEGDSPDHNASAELEAVDVFDDEVGGPGSLGVAVAGQAWTGAENSYGEAEATRYIEDPMKIRGSASRRIGCMRRVLEKLSTQLQTDMEQTAKEVQTTLRFCGMPAGNSKELPVDVESLLQHLADFLKVFAQHWEEVRSDLPRYQSVFGGGAS